MEKIDKFEKLRKKIQKQIGIMRRKKNLTQEELASKIGITAKSLSDIETGRRNISFITFLKICDTLEINLLKYMGDKNTNETH